MLYPKSSTRIHSLILRDIDSSETLLHSGLINSEKDQQKRVSGFLGAGLMEFWGEKAVTVDSDFGFARGSGPQSLIFVHQLPLCFSRLIYGAP